MGVGGRGGGTVEGEEERERRERVKSGTGSEI